ncbi:MAG: hypothetical protein KatS3mg023_2818 [Armatimonadota bacterium]|nr:MAG: hypothetical protein KatS3mg023_2818 [Armatimonadota bacterium]
MSFNADTSPMVTISPQDFGKFGNAMIAFGCYLNTVWIEESLSCKVPALDAGRVVAIVAIYVFRTRCGIHFGENRLVNPFFRICAADTSPSSPANTQNGSHEENKDEYEINAYIAESNIGVQGVFCIYGVLIHRFPFLQGINHENQLFRLDGWTCDLFSDTLSSSITLCRSAVMSRRD